MRSAGQSPKLGEPVRHDHEPTPDPFDAIMRKRPAVRSDLTSASGERPSFGSVQLATGVRMHFAESGDRSGEVVIMLHGYSDSWFSFSRVIPLLPPRFHVYALDQRGHGRTEQPESGYLMSDRAADVIAFMDAKQDQRATIVGHSMGSVMARQVVARAPDRVTRLVLVGSPTGFEHLAGMVELRAAVQSLRDPVPVEFVREFQYGTIHHPVPKEFMDEAIRAGLRLPARVWRALIDGMFPTPTGTAMGTTSAPTLVMWGEREAVVPRSELEALTAQFPTASVAVYAETGHALHWERPAQFAKDLETFLSL